MRTWKVWKVIMSAMCCFQGGKKKPLRKNKNNWVQMVASLTALVIVVVFFPVLHIQQYYFLQIQRTKSTKH